MLLKSQKYCNVVEDSRLLLQQRRIVKYPLTSWFSFGNMPHAHTHAPILTLRFKIDSNFSCMELPWILPFTLSNSLFGWEVFCGGECPWVRLRRIESACDDGPQAPVVLRIIIKQYYISKCISKMHLLQVDQSVNNIDLSRSNAKHNKRHLGSKV